MSLVFSGIQPTGHLHLGNYLGAIQQWVKLQDQHPCLFCIVDLHAITVAQEPAALREATYQTAAAYLACGIDPEKSIIYPQSLVSAHSELAWLLSCFTPMGWLNRMTQFKEKAGKARDNAVLGLFAYPVLMAADILAFQATHVPVGEDQKQHLELARDIAGAVNRHYNQELFTIPEPLILPTAARIMSLRDGTKKMSKSDPSEYSRITLNDDADMIRLRIQKAKTDPYPLPVNKVELELRVEAANLLTIYAALSGRTLDAVIVQFAGMPFAAFKKDLTDLAVAHLSPIQQRMQEFLGDKGELHRLMLRGAEKAAAIAAPTIARVRNAMGFVV